MRLVGITLSLLLISCAASLPAKEGDGTPPQSDQILPPPSVVSSSPTNAGQMLPISAQTQIKGERIMLEVARTPQQQQIGLMYRTSLPDDRGMLFSFDPPQPARFWMKNTLIELDMIFLQNGQVKAIAQNVPPCTTPTCPTYGPSQEILIDQVIELRGGRAAELGLKVGDRISIDFFDNRKPSANPSKS